MIVRRATAADALDVLAWRNDPLTRAMSRSGDEIDPDVHMAWFARAIADPRISLFIGEADGTKVGMVRFDHLEPTEVSININPACRGRGHGRDLLAAALAQVNGEVVADVLEDNVASRQLFEGAGFALGAAKRAGLRRYVRSGG